LINAVLFSHNARQARAHFSFQLATTHTIRRLIIGVTQVRRFSPS
jgi:hypothetical protein